MFRMLDNAWWQLMMLDNAWWCLMTLDDTWWHLMRLDDAWWSLMTLDEAWFKIFNYHYVHMDGRTDNANPRVASQLKTEKCAC